MVIPILDTWDDDNVTLGYGLNNGDVLTQGGDYRFRERQTPKSVVFSNNQQDSVLANQAILDRLSRLNVPTKPIITPAVQDRLSRVDVPTKPQSPQEQSLAQAEEELKQAKEEDAQTGSDGYEAKEDGVFARLKDFGGAMFGNEGKQDWENFKKDFSEKGIGAVGERANNLMEDMARSPYARFTDPTTVFGGQRRMVNDIDKYHDQRDIIALRDDLLKRDLVNDQTLLGQAEKFASWSPEKQAAAMPYLQMRKAGTQGVGDKNTEQMLVSETKSRFANNPNKYGNNIMNAFGEVLSELPSEARGKVLGSKYAEPINAVGLGQRYIADQIKNGTKPMQAVDDYRATSGDYTTPTDVLLGARSAGTYKPSSVNEFGEKKQVETARSEYGKLAAKEYAEFNSDYTSTMRGLQILRNALKDPKNKNMLGGWFNDTIQKVAAQLNLPGDNAQEFLASWNNAVRNMHGTAVRQFDPSGRITNEEQRKVDASIIDLNKSVAYNLKMVEDTMARLALGKVAAEERFNMAQKGVDFEDVSKFIGDKYRYMNMYPDLYVDPDLVEREKFNKGQFKWSNALNDWVFEEVR